MNLNLSILLENSSMQAIRIERFMQFESVYNHFIGNLYWNFNLESYPMTMGEKLLFSLT